MANTRRIVITGIGPVTPLGKDVDTMWKHFLDGKSAIRQIRSFDTSGLPTRLGAEITDFDAKQYVEKSQRRSLKVMARPILLAVAAAQVALNHSRVDKNALDPTRFGIEFGCGLIASELPELADAAVVSANCQPGRVNLADWGEKGLSTIQPLWMLKYLPNMPACHISILHNAQGPNNSITESDASGILALLEASRILRRNKADFFLVGGCESKMNPLSMVRQGLFESLSTKNDTPETACRPFDSDRDGQVLGEGATVLVVEDLEHARKRGAEIYGEVVGHGASFDRELDGKGLALACEAALRQAGIGPEDLDHVNAHGLSTDRDDVWEAQGLAQIVGDKVPVFAAKGYFGNLGAASGITELALSLMGLKHGVMPTTINHDKTDPRCPIRIHTGSPRAVTKPFALKVCYTHMGQCGAVVVRRWDN
ncbi:MAG: beta-ketoacyl-[acyl-carrier-protein] synthase family protein [Gemmataceae bacterium]